MSEKDQTLEFRHWSWWPDHTWEFRHWCQSGGKIRLWSSDIGVGGQIRPGSSDIGVRVVARSDLAVQTLVLEWWPDQKLEFRHSC